MSRARELSRLGNINVLSGDDVNSEVGIASTVPRSTLDVRGEMKVGTAIQAGTAGVLTATSFSGALGGNIVAAACTFTTGTFNGNVTIGGTLTYEDVTNVDALGIVTARAGVNVSGGQIQVGVAYSVGAAGVCTAAGFVGPLTGAVTGNATGLTGSPDIAINNLTVGSGITMGSAGVATFSGTSDVHLLDNVRLNIGDGSELAIYHDGSHSYISDQGTGNLRILTSSVFTVNNAANSENMILATDGGSVDLYYNANKKFETTNDGTVTTGISTATGGLSINADSKNLTIGASEDLKLFHDGSHSIIHDDGTGALKFVSANSFQFRDTDKDTGDYCINANIDGAVSLYHNGHKSIETIGAGITIYGPEGGAGQICLSSDEGDDNADKWRITKEAGNDSFRIQNYKSGSWETNILATGDGAVELYNDNVKTLETHSTGVTILGPEGDSAILYLNADEGDDNADKWRLLSSSANPQLYLQNYKDGGWETSIQMDGGGQTMLAYNDAGKLQTTNDGVKITGIVTASAGVAYTGLLRESFAKTDGRLSANTNIDLEDGMVHYFTTAENTTSTPNIRWNSSTSLNNKMNFNDAITVTIISAAAAAGYSAQMTIDGGGISEQWVGGEAPDEGGANGYDIYTYNILKTADATFFVIAHVVNAT